ncbi:hypothetical protein BH11ARM2_BH11ARM2_02750 [soil metagenome]
MRRFIASLSGKVISQLVILTLLMPTLTLALMSRAVAQVATLPTWAVVEFTNRKSAGTAFGKSASAAIIGELAKTGRYDIVPQENIQRAIETLGVDSPPKGNVNLLRVGQEVRASTIVNGDIVDYEVLNADGGKRARVSMLVVIYDVTSGIAVNGVAEVGVSTTRPSNTSDDALINDAIAQGASLAVRDILSKTLPTATVQNTTSQNRAFINQGARSGFKGGQSVIVTRGRQQVATAKITEVEADSATISIERNGGVGIQPGDKVRAIFDIPSLRTGFPNGDKPAATKGRSHGNPTGLLTILIVLGIVALLLSHGNSGSQNAAASVTNEAINDVGLAATESGVIISWTGDGFFSGQQQQYRWQIFRDDISDIPVQFAPGPARNARNTSALTLQTFPFLARGIAGGVDCNPSESNQTVLVRPVTTGRPYTYSVELVYRVLNLDLPDGGSTTASTATTNTTGTTNTGTTNTASTTGTANTGTTASSATTAGQGYTYCYFVSGRQSASGRATPLTRPLTPSPAANSELSGDQSFTFTTVGSADYPGVYQYTLEFSTTPSFAPGTWATAATQVVSRSLPPGTQLTFPSVATSGARLPGVVQSATLIYWRVGVRNTVDDPGPQRSANGERYVYSYPPTTFRPASAPPPPQ